MKKFIFLVTLGLLATAFGSAQTSAVSTRDIASLEGKEWQGTLTYVDYSSGKRTMIRANLKVTRPDRKASLWQFAYLYPDEPKSNNVSSVTISNNGKMFSDENVIERTNLSDKTIRIITTRPGKDNDRPATFRYTYLIEQQSFSIKKDVLIDGTSEWFERNTYLWTR